ncbi:MAG: hypothetical protein GY806_19995 [Gammaproteobacteria bacterium]|nr:hypothetical protein [Gammaproteobacteria bacterium]
MEQQDAHKRLTGFRKGISLGAQQRFGKRKCQIEPRAVNQRPKLYPLSTMAQF